MANFPTRVFAIHKVLKVIASVKLSVKSNDGLVEQNKQNKLRFANNFDTNFSCVFIKRWKCKEYEISTYQQFSTKVFEFLCFPFHDLALRTHFSRDFLRR